MSPLQALCSPSLRHTSRQKVLQTHLLTQLSISQPACLPASNHTAVAWACLMVIYAIFVDPNVLHSSKMHRACGKVKLDDPGVCCCWLSCPLPAGPTQGLLFDRDTLDPLVRTPAFVRAMEVMRELAALSEDTVPQVSCCCFGTWYPHEENTVRRVGFP
jgi:hypothetical protein